MRTSHIFTKAAPADNGRVSFICSTADVDRMGDVVHQNWDLKTYKKSPIVLFGHDHSLPIGRAHNVAVKSGNLEAEFEFMDETIDPFAAKIGRMAKEGWLKAVSVGFRPIEMQPRRDGGMDFMKNELLEISVVSVGANQNALAKSFGLNDSDRRRLFAAVSSTSEIRKRLAVAKHRLFIATHGASK